MGEVLALAGAVFVLLAAIGVVRFDDIFARMHALAKASTFGVLLLLAGAAVALHDANDVTSVALAALCQVLTSPPASNMLSRATYLVRTPGADASDVSEGRSPDAPSPSA